MLQITPIPALSDNYIWILQKECQAIIVDPAEAQAVFAFLAKHQLNPTAILLTHNHHDHTDGVAGLVAQFPDMLIYGSEEVSQFANQIVYPEQQFELLGLKVRVIESAGHTAQHISYLIENEYLFCGDALFSGGCGRVFTGDYQAQFDALQRFKALPDFVQVYAGHEYTQSNLKFAEVVMATNCVLMEYQERADILRSQYKPTLPSTIGIEKQINPFMQAVTLDEFISLRKQKDNF
ncbi:hydroxyacylglutathione hydrolase [Glaesserella parasuis]|uniref:Hydroxyacylglutathione hydrolase n=1 Tax=Glaesserella parasuis TaxID=738 RepID=A0AAX1M5G9_GLAPU|nr:hydroxyacylglutathione hydrolase [Glaesserella parasuis]MCT8516916.1 hydroxyacylglutathione hydrolase [Glaesserella parasuis]MCT8737262.1 hydroxyacylglutathione hydrolase [Glaesserella parasuis]MDE3972440.1 hydroxyacylglutathione hydrolase [Glaesserella parasuis]MDE4000000.1 hydroxyacylglutathione hydrolase [Glaesserella parasuis]MDG6809175.1 hydroxyacylglutathione hydrolase [Glaesserella parasuis]